MCFEGGLLHEEVIEAAIEAMLVDLFIPKLQQIAERRAAVSVILCPPSQRGHGISVMPQPVGARSL
jgi:hypothetical protein